MATTLPASLKPLRGAATTLQVKSPNGGSIPIDPAVDPAGYTQALFGSRDERVRQQRAAEDAATPITAPGYAQTMFNRSFNRAQEDGAQGPAGFNRDWVPFFEAQNVAADSNPGMKYKTDYGSLAAGMPLSSTTTDASGFAADPTTAARRRPPSIAALARQGGY